MSPRYLLPCACGKSVTVSAGQAGGQVTCSCGQTLDVPMLRDLRSLKPEGQPQSSTTAGNSGPQITIARAIFSVSILAAVIGFSIGAVLSYQRSTIDLGPSQPELTKLEEQSIDNMTIEDSLKLWNSFNTDGLTANTSTPWQQSKILHAQLGLKRSVAFSVGGAALLSAIVASIFARKQ